MILQSLTLQVSNVHSLWLRSWNIVFASTAAIVTLALQNESIFFGNIHSLVVPVVHEMLEVDFGSFEPFVRVHEPPDQNQNLRTNC